MTDKKPTKVYKITDAKPSRKAEQIKHERKIISTTKGAWN